LTYPLSHWERARVRGFAPKAGDTLTSTLSRGEGGTLNCAPSADAVAGRGSKGK